MKEKLLSCRRERFKELSNLDGHLGNFSDFLVVFKNVIHNSFYILQLSLSTLLKELPKVTARFAISLARYLITCVLHLTT